MHEPCVDTGSIKTSKRCSWDNWVKFHYGWEIRWYYGITVDFLTYDNSIVFSRRKSLFLGDKYELWVNMKVFRTKVSWWLQLTFKWFVSEGERERGNLEIRPRRKVLIIREFKGKIYVCSLYHSLNFLAVWKCSWYRVRRKKIKNKLYQLNRIYWIIL